MVSSSMMTPLKSKNIDLIIFCVLCALCFVLGALCFVLGALCFEKTRAIHLFKAPSTKHQVQSTKYKAQSTKLIPQPPVLFLKQFRQSFTLEHIEATQYFRQRQFVFKIYLIVEICSQSIFLTLPVLRHHDNGRLHSRDNCKNEVQHLVGHRIKTANQNVGVEDYPKDDQGD